MSDSKPLVRKSVNDSPASTHGSIVKFGESREGEAPKERTYKLGFMIQLVSIAAFGGFLFGYDTGIVAAAQLYITDSFPDMSAALVSFFVALAPVGAAFGSLFSGNISDKIGRKKVIMAADVFFLVGSVGMAVAPSVWVLLLARLVVGLGVGIASQIVPLYMAEVAPIEIRGTLVAFNTAVITIAQVIASAIGFLLIPSWRWMLALGAFPAIFQFFAFCFMPESPRWLGKMGQEDRARGVLERIYLPQFLDRVSEDLQKEVVALKEETKLTEKERLQMLCSTYQRCIVIGCGIQAFQQFIGINTAMYYGTVMLQQAGLQLQGFTEDESSILLNIMLAAINAIGTIASIFVIDKLGRRYIILRMTPFIALSWFVCAGGMAFTGEGRTEQQQQVGGLVAVIGICFFILTFAFGMSSTPWTLNAEIYPLSVIGTANSLSATTNWVCNTVVSEVFTILTEISTTMKVVVYVVLGLFAIACFFFTYFLIPETANKSIDQILEDILGRGYIDKNKEINGLKVVDEREESLSD